MTNATQPIAPILNDNYLLPDNYNLLDTTHIFRARCKYCLSFISGSRRTTSNFTTHIRRKHPQMFASHLTKQGGWKTWKGPGDMYRKSSQFDVGLPPFKMELSVPTSENGAVFPASGDMFAFLREKESPDVKPTMSELDGEDLEGEESRSDIKLGENRKETGGVTSKVNEIALRLQKNQNQQNTENEAAKPPMLTPAPSLQNPTNVSPNIQQRESEQKAINSCYMRAKRCNEKQQEITRELINFINEHELDVSIVNSEALKRLFEALNPLYIIPDGDFLSRFIRKKAPPT